MMLYFMYYAKREMYVRYPGYAPSLRYANFRLMYDLDQWLPRL